MSSVSWRRNLISAHAFSWQPVFGTVVRILSSDPWGRNMIGVEGASGWSPWIRATTLLSLWFESKQARINTRHLGDERKCRGREGLGREGNSNQRRLHDEGGFYVEDEFGKMLLEWRFGAGKCEIFEIYTSTGAIQSNTGKEVPRSGGLPSTD